MRKVGLAALATIVVAGSAGAGDVGVIKNPGWWGPIWVDGGPVYMLDGVMTSTTGTVRGGLSGEIDVAANAEAVAGAGGAEGGASAQMAAMIPAGSDRATLLRLRQALADEAARRGLR